MPDNFLGVPTWAPGGYVSEADEAAMQRAYQGIQMAGLRYSYGVMFSDDPYAGDEHYGGDAFQYIPTEVQVAAAIAMRNMSEAGELPVQTNDPGMAQLLQSLYQRTAQFWQDIRAASGTGW